MTCLATPCTTSSLTKILFPGYTFSLAYFRITFLLRLSMPPYTFKYSRCSHPERPRCLRFHSLVAYESALNLPRRCFHPHRVSNCTKKIELTFAKRTSGRLTYISTWASSVSGSPQRILPTKGAEKYPSVSW